MINKSFIYFVFEFHLGPKVSESAAMVWGAMSSAAVGALGFIRIVLSAASTRRLLEDFLLQKS